jgi:predicted glycoside hydrolase/deacetylase ChbG (UPF0249 family)
MTTGGLLIVNADDWGMDAPTTDAIHRCFDAGGVTSTSGMVFMVDSERAAAVATAHGLPVGLHINLTEPFTASVVEDAVRRRQQRLVDYFAGPSYRRWGVNAALFTEMERSIADQLREFRRIYAGEPSHFDGHQHIHQAIGILMARTIPTGSKMRPSLTFAPGEKFWGNRMVRSLVNRVMRARFTSPRYFFCIRDMHPLLGGRALGEKLALASGSAVEVMTHPSFEDERAILTDASWTALIGERRVGHYGDL